MKGQFILDANGTPVPEPNPFKWALWIANRKNCVVAKDFIEGIEVSTVFIGFDAVHDILDRPPRLWETMVFNDPDHHSFCRRYETLEQARAGHAAAVQMVRSKWN